MYYQYILCYISPSLEVRSHMKLEECATFLDVVVRLVFEM